MHCIRSLYAAIIAVEVVGIYSFAVGVAVGGVV